MPSTRQVMSEPPEVRTNGHSASPSPEENTFWRRGLALVAPDVVAIRMENYQPGTSADSSSWEDVAKIVDGIHWLLRGWIPYRMLSGIIGEPKAGKSAWVLWHLVRPIITGEGWFTGQAGAAPRNVLWCDTEGSIGLNIERMKKWGLPMDRIKTPYLNDPFRRINIDDEGDIARIRDVVLRYETPLVVVDSYWGSHKGDENHSKSGGGLNSLAKVTEETGAGMHVVHHTGKLPPGTELTANNARGSNVYLQMVRCLIGVDSPNPASDWRRARMLLESFGTAPPALGFRFTDTGLEFGPAPKRQEKEPQEPNESGADRAQAWLTVRMVPDEWYPAGDIITEAEALGFSHTGTLARAKKSLSVKTRKAGKGWEWLRQGIAPAVPLCP